MKNKDLSIGDKVKELSPSKKSPSGVEGIVLSIDYPEGELSIEDHGFVTIEITKSTENSYLNVGDEEHYSLYGWESLLKIIE